MPATDLWFFRDTDGSVPLRDWLARLRHRDRRGFAKCAARLRRLAALGHELRRPEADYLRDEIYELRAKAGHVNYRILYAFHGRAIAILLLGLTKEDRVPAAEIDRAVRRLAMLRANPDRHIDSEEPPDDSQATETT